MNTSLSSLLQRVCKANNANSCFAIDVGAHIGEYTQFLSAGGFFSKIIAFEPNPESYLKLLDEVYPADNCKLETVNAALSQCPGMLDLYCYDNTATASLLNYESGYLNNGTLNKYAVPVLTLDDYLIHHPVRGRLQLIKIDTQGNDLSVIKGGASTISVHRPIIQTEFIYIPSYEGQCTPAELTETLLQLDYEMYSLNNLHVTSEGRLAYCDAIFIPKECNIPVSHQFTCIDDQLSFTTQLQTLTAICAERLAVIELLDAELRRLSQCQAKDRLLNALSRKIKSWVQ